MIKQSSKANVAKTKSQTKPEMQNQNKGQPKIQWKPGQSSNFKVVSAGTELTR